MCGNNIVKELWYGVGKGPLSDLPLLHYLKMAADKEKFLFFNNGDAGCFVFDNISDVLKYDIYDVSWTENLGFPM
jgi:hypothetical protein